MNIRTKISTQFKRLLTLGTVFLFAGCAAPFPVYTISSNNITSIRSTQKTVEVGKFSGGPTSVSCRLQPLSPEGGRSFAEYMQGAFNDEVVVAGIPTARERSTVTLKLLNVDVDCGILSASWIIEAEVRVGSQEPYTIKTVRNFDGNYIGGVVLQRAYQAFVPTVQETIANVINHPTFMSEFGRSK